MHATVVALPDDDDELLKRRETARVVGVSETTVRRWADRGVLTPIVGPDGVHRYRAGEVRELTVRKVKLGPLAPDEYDGAAAAAVFQLLDDGLHPIDVVKRTRLHPRAVIAMQKQHARMRGSIVLTAGEMREIMNVEGMVGSWPSTNAAVLLENISKEHSDLRSMQASRGGSLPNVHGSRCVEVCEEVCRCRRVEGQPGRRDSAHGCSSFESKVMRAAIVDEASRFARVRV